MDEQPLAGGVANAGRVTLADGHVLRPRGPHTAAIHRLLRQVCATGFAGVQLPASDAPDGRERLVYITGDVPVPPFPAWAQTDTALASVADLLRRYHAAARSFDPAGATWSTELADPRGGPIVCHNDVCLENVVFRDGRAVGLIDFDFAAPGRPAYDVARMAAMCVPVDDDVNAARHGWVPANRPARLRLVADAAGVDAAGRATLLSTLDDVMAHGHRFVQRRVETGDANFLAMWRAMGGMERYDRRRAWWARHRHAFAAALR